ncbi:MAG: polymerase family protein [Ferruginibacter sp.]|nr:polymerase family protein [Ferruginibacter sp.]
MHKRFVTIWFRSLRTDWFTTRQPNLQNMPFVLALPDQGRLVITAVNELAKAQGVDKGMVVADARAILPSLQVLNDHPELSAKLLRKLADWCIRYTPAVAIDEPDGLTLDVTGCTHLWGGEAPFLKDIITRLKRLGYHIKTAIADTIGTAWGVARFGQDTPIVENGGQASALFLLPPEALRLEADVVERLYKLGLSQVSKFIAMPRTALRRRFGQQFLKRLDQALGLEEEGFIPVQAVEPYQERLPCLEPIVTATGIAIALERLLGTLCHQLQQEEKGLRIAIFKGYRMDGKIEKVEIGTNRPSHNTRHLFKLFEDKLCTIEPDPGIELFILEAQRVEPVTPAQQKIWEGARGLDDIGLSELMDRLACKIGPNRIHRYVPDEHYWPERSVKTAVSLQEELTTAWRVDRPRPIQLLSTPQLIEVTAPIPDYPPMLFRYKGILHKITRADGPERIEQEWWLQQGQHRDYYCVEDEAGCRYWLFRSGHYAPGKSYQWFIHGFFA